MDRLTTARYHVAKVEGGWEIRRPDGSLWCVRDSEAEAQEFANAANRTLEKTRGPGAEQEG